MNNIQSLAARIHMSYDEFIGEMRKRGCSEPTAAKIWEGNSKTSRTILITIFT